MALGARGGEHLALRDLALGLEFRLLHHALDVALGSLHILVAGADKLLRALELHRHLRADLVEQVERLVAVEHALVVRQRRVLRLVDHLIQHIQQLLYILFSHRYPLSFPLIRAAAAAGKYFSSGG